MHNTIFFNLATYVPKSDRERKAGLKINPNLDGHILMGGTFAKFSLFEEPESPNFTSHWIWNEESFADDILKAEKAVLQKIYAEFKALWDAKKSSDMSPTTFSVGIGVTRMDLPFLYCRAVAQNIDTPANLYDVFLAGFPIDLSNVGSVFVMTEKKSILRPAATNDLLSEFQLSEDKQRGTIFWDYFDNAAYENIEKKTFAEAQKIVKLYYRMKKKALDQWPSSKRSSKKIPKMSQSQLNKQVPYPKSEQNLGKNKPDNKSGGNSYRGKSSDNKSGSNSYSGKSSDNKSGGNSYRSKSDNRSDSNSYRSKSSNNRSGNNSYRGKSSDNRSGSNSYRGNKSSDRRSGGNSYRGKSSDNRPGNNSYRGNKSSDRRSGGNSYRGKSSDNRSGNNSYRGNKSSDHRSSGNSYRGKSSDNKSGNNSYRGNKSSDHRSSGNSYRGKSSDNRSGNNSYRGNKSSDNKSGGNSYRGKSSDKKSDNSYRGKPRSSNRRD